MVHRQKSADKLFTIKRLKQKLDRRKEFLLIIIEVGLMQALGMIRYNFIVSLIFDILIPMSVINVIKPMAVATGIIFIIRISTCTTIQFINPISTYNLIFNQFNSYLRYQILSQFQYVFKKGSFSSIQPTFKQELLSSVQMPFDRELFILFRELLLTTICL